MPRVHDQFKHEGNCSSLLYQWRNQYCGRHCCNTQRQIAMSRLIWMHNIDFDTCKVGNLSIFGQGFLVANAIYMFKFTYLYVMLRLCRTVIDKFVEIKLHAPWNTNYLGMITCYTVMTITLYSGSFIWHDHLKLLLCTRFWCNTHRKSKYVVLVLLNSLFNLFSSACIDWNK